MKAATTPTRAHPCRREAVRAVAPSFSHRVAPAAFTASSSSVTPAPRPATQSSTSCSRQSTRLQAAARPSVYLFSFGGDDDYEEDYTVLKVQVGLFGDIRKWQKDLERLSELYDTEDDESLHYIMQETVTKLLRNMEYCGYGQTAGKVYDNLDECEQKFNQVSLEERTKFKEETYSNVDGRRRRRTVDIDTSSDTGLDSWLCCTLLVAMEGKLKLPKVNGLADMRKALTTLGSVPPDCLLAFELMWTPQADGDSYSKDELMMDFPTLALL